MNQKLIVRILALLLVLAMVLGMIPLVFADEGNLGSGTPDGEPPVLLGMELSMTTISAPNTIDFTIDATDDVSGVASADIWFTCKETGKTIYAGTSRTYWDPEAREYVPYPDGKFHGKLQFDEYVESGTFTLDYINLRDVAGNTLFYYNDYTGYGAPLPETITDRTITVVASNAPDTTPPVLVHMDLDSNALTAPGSIEFTIEATDDVSGVASADIWFTCKETGKTIYSGTSRTYWDPDLREYVPYPDGKFHGTLTFGQYLESGTFTLDYINLRDVAGNSLFYYKNYTSYGAPLPETITDLEIVLTDSGTPDSTPPELVHMDLATTTIAVPGRIEFTIEATDDVSGVTSADIWFTCKETGKTIYSGTSRTYWDPDLREYVPYPDGKFHGTLTFGQYLESGTFTLDYINLKDVAGNSLFYHKNYTGNGAPLPETITELSIQVLNSVPDVTTSVANPEFVGNLENAVDDAYIVADYSGEATLPETAFDAISGTDKTLDLVSEGVTWRFNGNDIVNESKPIDLNVNITKLEESPSAEIQEKLEDIPAVVMKFAENGVLPGKATIQVKVDYAMREYLGASRELCVYYFNNQTGELELIAENLMVINDTYIEFPITHCSYYILSTKIGEKEEPEHEAEYGDVNHDGRINVTDAVMVMKHRANALTEDDFFCERCANVDINPKINVSDAVLIMKKRANKDMVFPIEQQ